MEGTPISGAASGWRRWRVCDPSRIQTSCGVYECGGNRRGDDTWIWQIFLLWHNHLAFTHTKKHTLLSDVSVAHSLFGVLKQQHSVSPFFSWQITENSWGKRRLRMGRKLWNHWNIPLRDVQALNHWHTLWRRVSWVSQLGHYKLGYGDGETAPLRFSCS